jgi:hypothetical protein
MMRMLYKTPKQESTPSGANQLFVAKAKHWMVPIS